MHVNGQLGSKLVRQWVEESFLVGVFPVAPQVIEPLNHPSLEMSWDLVKAHVGFHAVHFILEVHFGGVQIGDDATHVAHDGGKE